MTELVFILDRSGSMAGLEKDTIGGFNSMIEKQKKQFQQKNANGTHYKNQKVRDTEPLYKQKDNQT